MSDRLCVLLLCLCFCRQIVAQDQNVKADSSAAPSSTHKTILTEDQITRGRAIRELLVGGIDFAREHGVWPKDLRELKIEYVPTVTYLGPPPATKNAERFLHFQLANLSPVCHEALEKYPDGVWVGYANGHIELVYDAAGLRLALSQLEQARPFLEDAQLKSAVASTVVPKPDAKRMVKLVDEAGQAVEGAQVGHVWNANDGAGGNQVHLMTIGTKTAAEEPMSNASGNVEIQYCAFFYEDNPPDRPAQLIAYHKAQGLIAIANLRSEDFINTDGTVSPPLMVTLHPGIRVTGSLSQISARAQPPTGRPSLISARSPAHGYD